MSARRIVPPPWATDNNYLAQANPTDGVQKSTSRRYTSNVPLPSGIPGDFQTWGSGAHDSEASSWNLRNRPLPEVYGGIDKKISAQNSADDANDNPLLFRKKTPSLDANPYEGVLGEHCV